jgi:hypothetical protein
MSLACKNAIVERDVANLIYPDDVQTLTTNGVKASSGSVRCLPAKPWEHARSATGSGLCVSWNST